MIAFTCNVCGERAIVPHQKLDRETPSCPACGSTVRYRAIAHALALALFGKPLSIPAFPCRPRLAGIGMSDWEPLAARLGERLGYRNTHYHREPRLDITRVPPELAGSLDFVLCSDVLEHVGPPVERALASCFELLRPGGVLVLTVPFSFEDKTVEHFPDLHEYETLTFHGRPILVNRTRDGRWQVFDDLVFHGGEGETLELRRFAREPLLRQLAAAGFVDIVEHTREVEEYGIVWSTGWPLSVPVVARRPLGESPTPGG